MLDPGGAKDHPEVIHIGNAVAGKSFLATAAAITEEAGRPEDGSRVLGTMSIGKIGEKEVLEVAGSEMHWGAPRAITLCPELLVLGATATIAWAVVPATSGPAVPETWCIMTGDEFEWFEVAGAPGPEIQSANDLSLPEISLPRARDD